MTYAAFGTENRAPCEGPRTIPVNLRFDAAGERVIDFVQEIQTAKLSLISGFMVNNYDGPTFDLITDITGFTVHVPASAQGQAPLLTVNPPRFTIRAQGAGLIRLQFVNFMVPVYDIR